MQKASKVVAVTGASGYIGTRLLMQLETNPNVGEVVAFDRIPLPYPIHNIYFYQQELCPPTKSDSEQANERKVLWFRRKARVREEEEKPVPSIEPVLRRHRVDTLVHLACTYSHTDTYQDWATESQDNLSMLDFIQKCSTEAGVRHIVFLSSHRVYGTFPDNPMPISESAALRATPGDFLGHASFASDLDMVEFKEEQDQKPNGSGVKVTILRACPVLGFSDDHFRAEHVFPYHFLGAGENPPFQFLHEIDLANLLEEVIQREQEGVFNVAGEGVVFLRELAEITRRKLTQLPTVLAYPAAGVSARMGKSGTGNWNLNTSRYPVIMNTGKVKQMLNYRFRYTSLEALNAFVNYNGL